MFDQEEKRPPRPSKDDTDAVAQLPVGSAVVEEIEIQTDSDNLDGETTAKSKDEALPASLPPYSAFTHGQKISITILVSFLAVISPLSGQIYLPALESLANDLNVPVTYINLTITTFMASPSMSASWATPVANAGSRSFKESGLRSSPTSPTSTAAGLPILFASRYMSSQTSAWRCRTAIPPSWSSVACRALAAAPPSRSATPPWPTS